jgi:hypothetical protein
MALDEKQISKICSKHGLKNGEDEIDTSYGFYLLHKSCHEKGGVLSKRLTKLLNERYAGIIRVVRGIKCSSDAKFGGNPEIADKLKLWIDKSPEGAIWALLTDPRQSFQHHGVYLVHQISYAAFRDACCENVVGKKNADELAATQRELEQSLNRLLQKKTEMEDLQRKLIEAEQHLMALQVTCDRHQQRISELEKRPGREKQLQRRIRMLEHELAHIRQEEALSSEKTDDNSNGRIKTRIQPHENTPTHCSCAVDESRTNALETSESPDCSPCSLDNLRVAVVGGLDRLEPHYRRIVENLGAQFCFHNGDCHGGSRPLKNVVCQSDIIMFITRVNSHSALHVVKGLCRKTGKRFTVLRETSPHALAKALRRTA